MNTKLEVIRLTNEDVIATSTVNCDGVTHYKCCGSMSPGVYSLEAFTFDGTNYYYDDSVTTSLNDTQASNVNNGNAIQDYDVLVKINNQYVLVDNCQHQLEYNDR